MTGADTRPLLLLDFDGVLNALDVAATKRTHEHRTLHGYTLRISRDLLAAIPQLDATYEVRWLSTWRDATEGIAAAYGLPSWSWLDFREPRPEETSIAPKFEVAAPLIATARNQGRRVAWVDDELTEAHHDWARLRTHPSLLLVQPSAWDALLPEHTDKLLDFASRDPASWPPPAAGSGSHAPFVFGGEDSAA